jgi:MFS family permease
VPRSGTLPTREVLTAVSELEAGAPRHANIAFGALAIGALAFCLLQSMVVPALPEIQRDLGASSSAVAWIFTAYLLSASVATPILGRLGDMFGKQRMLVLVFATLSLGCIIAGLANSLGVLLVGRVLQGVAGAVFPLSFGILRDEFRPEQVAGRIGFLSAMIGVGSGAGLVIAGPVTEHLNYHWLFWIPLVLAAAATAATALFIPESPVRTPGRINILAAITLSGWLVLLLLGITQGPSWGWGSPATLTLFVTAALLFVLWVQIERGSQVPLVDLRMMVQPAVWWTNVTSFLLGVSMYASNIVIPPLIETPKSTGYGFGASVTAAGFYLLPSTLTMLVAGLTIGPITSRLASRGALILGVFLSAAPYLMLTISRGEPWELLLASAVNGFGIGLAYSAMPALVMAAVPPAQTGVATGMNANIRTIGGAVGAALVATVLASSGLVNGYPRNSAYTLAFGFLTLGFALAVCTALAIPRRLSQTGDQPHGGDLPIPEPVGLVAEAGALISDR